jgi:tetratricopeptide (TPR) repeat protein
MYKSSLLERNCLYQLNRPDEAMKAYDKALSLKENNNGVGAIYNKGYIEYNINQDYKKALELFQHAIEIVEKSCEDEEIPKKYFTLYYSEGLCYFQLEEYQKSLNSFLKAKNLEENDYLIKNNIGRCYHKLKEYEEAIKYFAISFSLSDMKYYVALYNQAMSLLKIRDKEFEAKKIFECLIDDYNSEFWPAYFGLGLYYNHLMEYNFALDYFNKALSIYSEYLDIYLHQGISYYRLKRYTESIECFDYILSKSPGHLNGIVYFNKGNSLKAIKRLDEAIECYLNAIKYQKKQDSDYYYNLAHCQFLAKKTNNALTSIEESIKINPTWKNYYLKGIIMAKNNKDFLGMIENFNKSIQLNKDFCDNYYNKAKLFFEAKRYREALDNIEIAIKKYDPKKKKLFGKIRLS